MPFLIFALLALASVFGAHRAIADEIDDLLRQTDQALGRGGHDADKPPSKSTTKKQPPAAPVPTSSSPASPTTPNAALAPKPVLTPTDAESVKELINVGLRREAQLRPDDREKTLQLAVGFARLHGSHELSKDDDTFRVQSGERLTGASLSYLTDTGDRLWSAGLFGAVRPVAKLGAGYLKGTVAVDRTGVQNTRIDPDYNLIPVSAGFGVRNATSRQWRLSATYGPAVEMLVQTGEGTSDSTSGMFFADALDVAAERALTERLWLGVAWQARGLLPLAGDEAGHHMLAITINTPLAG